MADTNTTVFAIEVQGQDDVVKGFATASAAAQGAAASSGKATDNAAAGTRNWTKSLKDTGAAAGDVASRIGALGGAAGKQFADMTSQVLQLGAAFTGGPLIAGLAAVGAAISLIINKLEESYAKDEAFNDRMKQWGAEQKRVRDDAIAAHLKTIAVLNDEYVARKRAAVAGQEALNVEMEKQTSVAQSRLDYLRESKAANEEIGRQETELNTLRLNMANGLMQARKMADEAQDAADRLSLVKKIKASADAGEKVRAINDETRKLQVEGAVAAAEREAADTEGTAQKIRAIRAKLAADNAADWERHTQLAEKSDATIADADKRKTLQIVANRKREAEAAIKAIEDEVAARMAAAGDFSRKAQENLAAYNVQDELDQVIEYSTSAHAALSEARRIASAAALKANVDALLAELDQRKAMETSVHGEVTAGYIAELQRRLDATTDVDERANIMLRITEEQNAQVRREAADRQRQMLVSGKSDETLRMIELDKEKTEAFIANRNAETEAAVVAMRQQAKAELYGAAANEVYAASMVVVSQVTSTLTQQMAKLGDVNRENWREFVDFSENSRAVAAKLAQGIMVGIGIQATGKAIFEAAEAVKETALGIGGWAAGNPQATLHFQSAATHAASAAMFGSLAGVSVGAGVGIGMMRGDGGLVGLTAEEKAAKERGKSGGGAAGRGSPGGSIGGGGSGGAAQGGGGWNVTYVYEAGAVSTSSDSHLAMTVARGNRLARNDGYASRMARQSN